LFPHIIIVLLVAQIEWMTI